MPARAGQATFITSSHIADAEHKVGTKGGPDSPWQTGSTGQVFVPLALVAPLRTRAEAM